MKLRFKQLSSFDIEPNGTVLRLLICTVGIPNSNNHRDPSYFNGGFSWLSSVIRNELLCLK
jgi:hypothetical protein